MAKLKRLELPPGAQLVYLAEGGANIIYRIVWTAENAPAATKKKEITPSKREQMSIPPELAGKLLRLRKETTSGFPYQEIARNVDKAIRPLFKPEELVDHTLVRLSSGFIQQCNEQLHAAEVNGTRPCRRQGVYLSLHEPYGLLVTDMTTYGDPDMVMAEFKPKWLLQSPSAPPNARRCRTCALREMNNHAARKAGRSEDWSFCPLSLVSDQFEDVVRAARFIKGCQDPVRLAQILYQNPTLLNLQAHQKNMPDVGLYGQPAHSREKSLAMTLRDCTMFVKMPKDGRGNIEARLGDLDMKTGAGGKAQYWLDLEHQLITQGWYTGTDSGQSSTKCILQRIRHPS